MVTLAAVAAALTLAVGPELQLSKAAGPVAGARVSATVRMVDMNMGTSLLTLTESGPGRYATADPALGMPGRWAWRVAVRPRGGPGFVLMLVDRVRG
jgi:hypothetical protein